MLIIRNLCYSYGKNTVLNNINLQLNNTIYVLLGNNGVGKTTFMRCVSGYYKVKKGSVLNGDNTIPKIGYLPQKFNAYHDFTVAEFLDYMACIKGEKETKEIIVAMELQEIQKQKIKTLSGGMLKRVGIAQALIGYPDVVLLDEPTASLDIQQKKIFYDLMNKLTKKSTVIISTHSIEDVKHLNAEILLQKDGNINQVDWSNDMDKIEEKYICYLN